MNYYLGRLFAETDFIGLNSSLQYRKKSDGKTKQKMCNTDDWL